MPVPSRMKWWLPSGQTTPEAKFWPCSTCIPSSSTCTGRSAPTSSSRCSAGMDAGASSSTGCTDCWPTIRTTSAEESSPTGSASRPAASASATTSRWSSGPPHAVRDPTAASMLQNPIPSRLRRRRSREPSTNMLQMSGTALAMSSTSWRGNPFA